MGLIRKEKIIIENGKKKEEIIEYKKERKRWNFVKLYQDYLEELINLNKDAYKVLLVIIKNYDYDGVYISTIRWYIKNLDIKVNLSRGLKELIDKKIIFKDMEKVKINIRYVKRGI